MLLGFGEVDVSTLPPAGVVYLADGEGVQFERFTPQLLVVDGRMVARVFRPSAPCSTAGSC